MVTVHKLDLSARLEHKFDGTLEENQEGIFLNASHFRVHRFLGASFHEREDVELPSYREALEAARDALIDKYRVLVYAITETGRSFCVPPDLYLHYAYLAMKYGKWK